MKVAIVQVALSHGGAERVGVLIANGLSRKGHKTIILTDLNEPVTYETDPDITICDFAGKKTIKFAKWFKTIRNIRSAVKKEKPDVIIGVMGLCTLITYIACLGLGIPIVMTEHYAFERPDNAPLKFKQKLFKFYINKLYTVVTVLTEADKRTIGNRLRKVIVMPNPLFLKPVEAIPPKEKTILAVGHLDRWYVKGFDVLIESWIKIQDLNEDERLNNWWLKIAGDGKRESFEHLMNLLPDGEWECNDNVNDDDNFHKGWLWKSEKYQIEFLGFQKDMESLYKKSKIFVLSSRYEGFGLVLIEAMSQGCAPIACDYKGRQAEILNPQESTMTKTITKTNSIEFTENGVLCEPDDVEALAAGLQKMMDDEKYRKECQQKAVERSKFYDLDNITGMWEELLKSILPQ